MSKKELSKQEAIALERHLAGFANVLDSLVRIPFTKQGVGADAAIGTVPVVGDITGFGLAMYAIYRAWQVGVPFYKLLPAVKLAILDITVGVIPIVGDVLDVFIRPSRKALDIVHVHLKEAHGIDNDDHVMHPFLHRQLEKKQQNSAFWRNSVVSWLWLRIPDVLGLIVIIWLLVSMYYAIHWMIGLFA